MNVSLLALVQRLCLLLVSRPSSMICILKRRRLSSRSSFPLAHPFSLHSTLPLSLFPLSLSLQPPKHVESFGSVTGYYIGYKVVDSDKPYTFKTIEESREAHAKLEALVAGLKKSTMYTFSVQAFNTKGAGPSSPEVTCKTLDKDPPATPKLSITSVMATAVALSWSLPPDSSPVNGLPFVAHMICSANP